MKYVLLLVLFLNAAKRNEKIALLDPEMKKPICYADRYSEDLLFKNAFPVFTDDLPVLSEAAIAVAKMINNIGAPGCDTLACLHSKIILHRQCKGQKTVMVSLETTVNNTHFYLQLVKPNDNLRQAQKKMLDFGTYLFP